MRLVRAIILAALAALAAMPVQAQTYPTKPVRILVGFAAGSGPDVLARTLASQLGADLGQNFFIENRLGANGTIALRALVQSEPDGHTLLYSSSSITPIPYVYKNLTFDLLRDLAPIATVGLLDGYLLLVHPSLPVRNVPEFIAYAKQNRVLYGSPGVGNALHLVAELFNIKAGLSMEHVPYRGASEVSNALLGQSIHFMAVTPPSVIGLVKDGKLRAIAVTSSARVATLPDIPTVQEGGVANYNVTSWYGVFGPAALPPAIVKRLHSELTASLKDSTVVQRLATVGAEPSGMGPEEFGRFVRQEIESWAKVVKASGATAN